MIDVYIASAFSKNGQGGNKAGVVFDKPDLTAAQKISKPSKKVFESKTNKFTWS